MSNSLGSEVSPVCVFHFYRTMAINSFIHVQIIISASINPYAILTLLNPST